MNLRDSLIEDVKDEFGREGIKENLENFEKSISGFKTEITSMGSFIWDLKDTIIEDVKEELKTDEVTDKT